MELKNERKVMDSSYGFCDLNISASESDLKATVIEALKLGYHTIAITREITDEQPVTKKKKKEKRQELPLPPKLTISDEDLSKHGLKRKPIILTRITIIYSDPGSPIFHKFKDVFPQYDIIAFTPTSEAAFKQVCQANMDADIIALNEELMDYHPSRKLLHLAIKRDIFFELSYVPCIKSALSRQQTIQLGHMLHRISRSVKVILTSKAQRPEDLRSPHDVANLGIIFGLTPEAGNAALLSVAWATLHCARQRRQGGSKCSAEIDILTKSKKTKYSSLIAIDDEINAKD